MVDQILGGLIPTSSFDYWYLTVYDMTKDTALRNETEMRLQAVRYSRAMENRHRTMSISSFLIADHSESEPRGQRSVISRALSVGADFPVDCDGLVGHGGLRKSFRKKVKKMAEKERKAPVDVSQSSTESGSGIEEARSAFIGGTALQNGDVSKLVDGELNGSNVGATSTVLPTRMKQLKAARLKLFAVRTAIDIQPALVEKTRSKLIAAEVKKEARSGTQGGSPGALSLYADSVMRQRNAGKTGIADAPVSQAEMRQLVAKCATDTALTQHLLYTPRYDANWKSSYTNMLVPDKTERPANRKGWVVPLKRICEAAGISGHFFTDDKGMALDEARVRVLKARLVTVEPVSEWLLEGDATLHSNPALNSYLACHLEPRSMQVRLAHFVSSVQRDRDRTMVSGKFYNNVQLSKRMFGPSKKQAFASSIIGGMERRFEILDNQVNHIPLTRSSSDKHSQKCRNIDIHCRESTRVVLNFPEDGLADNDFIHANWVKGGPLFNDFIIAQAPMDNTIGDFWSMIWQEKVAYIFMLTSRQEDERCASYWPRHPDSSPLLLNGLCIETIAVSSSRDPLCRVTSIRMTGPDGSTLNLEHWQGNFNNSENLQTPLNLLRLARNCPRPTVIHDHLGISRASVLVAIEAAICNVIKGPSYKHLVQQAVQFVRSCRAFSVETPMQFIFIHRCVLHFFRDLTGRIKQLEIDYSRWLTERSKQMFLEDLNAPIPGFKLLSPKVDPDLLRMVRRPRRPDHRREAPDCVGEWPLPLTDDSPARRLLL